MIAAALLTGELYRRVQRDADRRTEWLAQRVVDAINTKRIPPRPEVESGVADLAAADRPTPEAELVPANPNTLSARDRAVYDRLVAGDTRNRALPGSMRRRS